MECLWSGNTPNLVPSKEGGGIADNMVYRQTSNQVGYPIGGNWGGDSPYPHPDIGGHEKIPNKGKYGTGFSMRELLAKYNINPELYEYGTYEDYIAALKEKAKDDPAFGGPHGVITEGGKVIEPRLTGLTKENIGLGPHLTTREVYDLNRMESARSRGEKKDVIESGDLQSFINERRNILAPYNERKNKVVTFPPYVNNTIKVDETETIIPSPTTIKKPEGIESLLTPQPIEIDLSKMPKNIKGPTRRDKWNIDQYRIQAEENSLMELMKKRTEGRKEQLTESKDAQTRANWLNVAQLFSRMGSATPRQGGIMGVIGAGLEAADQTLPQFAATNAKFRDERKSIQNDIEDDKIDQARVKLGALEKRASKEHSFQREELADIRFEEAKKTEELRFNKNYEQKEKEIDSALAAAGVLDINDITKIDALTKVRHFGGTFNAQGNVVFADGEALDGFSNKIASSLSELTGTIMQANNMNFNQAQEGIRSIKNKLDALDQDTFKKIMKEFPQYDAAARKAVIENMVEKTGLDQSVIELILKR